LEFHKTAAVCKVCEINYPYSYSVNYINWELFCHWT